MLSAILFAGLAVPADPIIDRTQPLLSDFDISGTQVSISVENHGSFYEYTYRFDAPETNIGEVQDFLLDTGCDAPVASGEMAALFPGMNGESFVTQLDGHYYMPTLGMWKSGKPGLIDVYPGGNAHFWLMLEPGETEILRIRSTGAPVQRQWSLRPDVEYYERIDWPESGHIVGLPSERDFTVVGVGTGPGCSSSSSESGSSRLAGADTHEEFEHVDTLLTYSAPLRNRMHINDDWVEMTLHYGEDIDPASFETCPASARKYFNPVSGATETLRIPMNEARNFLALAAHATGEQPMQPGHDRITFSPIDVDVFEFRRHDLDYQPQTIECELYAGRDEIPEELIVYAPEPPPRFDGEPLFQMVHAPPGPVTVFPGSRQSVGFMLSELADPESLRATIDGTDVTGSLIKDHPGMPLYTLPLPTDELGEHHVVISATFLPDVIGAPGNPERIEKTVVFRGMQVHIQGTAVKIAPDGTRTEQPTRSITVEMDPKTGEPVQEKDNN